MAKDLKTGNTLKLDEIKSLYYLTIFRRPNLTNNVNQLVEYFKYELLIDVSDREMQIVLDATETDEVIDKETLLRTIGISY